MSLTVIDCESSQLAQKAMTNAELQSECVPEEVLASIMAAQITEEFRKFLLVIALRPQSAVSREAVEVGVNRN